MPILPDCRYHVECLTHRLDPQHQCCCRTLDDVARYFAENRYLWTGQRFIRPARMPGECHLAARVLDQETQRHLTADDMEAELVPLFFEWVSAMAETEDARDALAV